MPSVVLHAGRSDAGSGLLQMASWQVARVPRSYGSVDDHALCRHVRVKRSATTLESLKRAVLKAYEDQYKPADITLFTRKYDDNPTVLRTDRQVQTQVLSYGPDWVDLAGSDSDGTVLLVVSPMNEEESELLVLPAAHSVPRQTLLRDLTVPNGVSAALSAAGPLIRRLADAEGTGLFDPLPLPGHIDDWLAQYREALQSTPELLARDCPRPAPSRNVIYLQPLILEDGAAASDQPPANASNAAAAKGGKGGKARAAAPDPSWLFARVHEYLEAFFHGTPVRLLEAVTMRRPAGSTRLSLFGKSVTFRDFCPGNDKPQPQGQLSAPELLRALAPTSLRGKSGGKTHVGGALPADGFCILGMTTADIFCAADDVFTGGLASPAQRAGLLSFHRYLYRERASGQPASGAEALLGTAERVPRGLVLARACKTAAHEVLHMYGIGHCLHRACLMNGAGSLLEDFAAPPYCCPVDLSKLVAALGPACEIVPRYRALLEFCEAKDEDAAFSSHAQWIRRALAALGEQVAGAPVSDAAASSEGRPATHAAGQKVPRSNERSPSNAKKRKAAAKPDPPKASPNGDDEDDLPPLQARIRARMG